MILDYTTYFVECLQDSSYRKSHPLFSFHCGQNRSFNRWDPNPKVSNSIIRQHWDPSKSPKVNMSNLGLVSTPNNVNPSLTVVTGSSNFKVIELFDVPDSDDLNKKSNRLPLDNEEQKYIAKCIAKHGSDYTKMFRDIKVNNMQHTEIKLQKMASRFLLLSSEQRLVEVPENCM
jgi:hypothetical protein